MPLREVCPAFRKIPIAAQTIRKSPQRDNTEVKKKKKKKKNKQEICTSELKYIHRVCKSNVHRFSRHDVTTAVKLFSCVNAFFCSNKLAQKLAR